MLKRRIFVCALLLTTAVLPARADDLAGRVDQLEEQIRQLTGQVEQLNYQLKQMQAQSARKLGEAEPVPAAPQAAKPASQLAAAAPAPAPAPKKKPLVAAQDASAQGVETIDEAPVLPQAPATVQDQAAAPTEGAAESQVAGLAPAPKPLGLNTKPAAQAADGGFQGKVLVAPGGVENATGGDDATAVAQPASLQPETPDDLFLRSEKALLQLQYSDAEQGFKDFVAKYPDHNLAGSAEFKLGETYWAQQDYTSSAKAYLDSYKKWPKGRRAPDSLLKLGLSLARLGQKDQACATIGSVDSEFPSAVEVKKRAQAEFKREGC